MKELRELLIKAPVIVAPVIPEEIKTLKIRTRLEAGIAAENSTRQEVEDRLIQLARGYVHTTKLKSVVTSRPVRRLHDFSVHLSSMKEAVVQVDFVFI